MLLQGEIPPETSLDAARQAHWAAGYVISRDFGAQLRLEVLGRCLRRAAG